jgi:muconolactone delta-isomerase
MARSCSNAQRAGIPLIIIGGAGPSMLADMGSLQDMNHVELMRPITKWAVAVPSSKRLGEYIATAFRVGAHEQLHDALASLAHRLNAELDVAGFDRHSRATQVDQYVVEGDDDELFGRRGKNLALAIDVGLRMTHAVYIGLVIRRLKRFDLTGQGRTL